MKKLNFNKMQNTGKKLAGLLLVACTTMGAFATLGDGKKKTENTKKDFLSGKTFTPGTFSLKSGYTYRGNLVINTNNTTNTTQYVRLNTVVTLQKGNITYTVPLRKNVMLDKVKINIGNRQFQKN
jgi:hypothetical protein